MPPFLLIFALVKTLAPQLVCATYTRKRFDVSARRTRKMNDGVETVPESEGEHPAYGAWGKSYEVSGPSYEFHCAGAGEFCFFCEFEDGGCPDDTGDDLRGDLSKMAVTMLQNRSEPRVVARRLHEVYAQSVQPHVAYTRASGMEVCSPDWSLESIERHLMFSTEYKDVFHSWLDRSHQAMLVRIGDKLVTNDGRVCPLASRQFTVATKSYIELQKALKALQHGR